MVAAASKGVAVTDHNEDPRSSARRKAQKHFTSAEQRDALVRKELESHRAQIDAKNAKLRALRLAKEAEDASAPAPQSPPETRKPRAPRAKRIMP
jgi:hypothetical protein